MGEQLWQDDPCITITNLINYVANTESDPFLIKLLQKLEIRLRSEGNAATIFDEILAWLWDRLHDNHWQNISNSYRCSFGIISAVRVKTMMSLPEDAACPLPDVFSTLDIGILMGSPESHHILSEIGRQLTEQWTGIADYSVEPERCCGSWRLSNLPQTIPPRSTDFRDEITFLDISDMVKFYSEYFLLGRPVVIKNGAEDWPAMQKWNHLSYIQQGKTSPRIVIIALI
jgi:hypothetical protein